MTVSEVLSSCMNILYGATVVHLYGKHGEQWGRKEVDWWRINRIKEDGLTALDVEIHVL